MSDYPNINTGDGDSVGQRVCTGGTPSASHGILTTVSPARSSCMPESASSFNCDSRIGQNG